MRRNVFWRWNASAVRAVPIGRAAFAINPGLPVRKDSFIVPRRPMTAWSTLLSCENL